MKLARTAPRSGASQSRNIVERWPLALDAPTRP
jgi:hypothetical protein